MNDVNEVYLEELEQIQKQQIKSRQSSDGVLDNDGGDLSEGQFRRNAPLIESQELQNEAEPFTDMQRIVPRAANQEQVPTDREMVDFSNPGAVETGVNESATAAGMGALGGLRGFGRAVRRNPLIMFPKRAARSVTNLFKGAGKLGWKLLTKAGRGIQAGWKRLFGGSAPAAAQPAAAQPAAAQPAAAQDAAGEEPSISVDSESAYGQHMKAKAQLREDMQDPSKVATDETPEPQGYKDTVFGNANSINFRMKAGKGVSADERAYLRLMNQKAMSITEQSKSASPDNTTAFPFSQRTQADQKDSGAATTGHVLTAIGGAINDDDSVRPEGDAAGKAFDVLNAGANLGKAGMKQLDKLAKDKGFDDEKVLGSAGKAYADVGKAAQFTYGFVGKDAAKMYDHLNPGADGLPGHAGKDLTKQLDPYLNIKNLDRITPVEAEIPGTGGMKYSKNFNALSAGKFVEHPATIMRAAGTGLTEKYGKPFEKMHNKRADLLERQFSTTVMRRMLQADRANADGLIDDEVDEERRGQEAFPNARAGLLQSATGEAAAAMKLGKQAQQSGYSSNYGQDMNTTAMLNDKKHQRQYGGEFNKLMKARNDVRLRSDATQLDEEVKQGLLGTDDEDKQRRDLAARAIAQFGIRTAYRTKKGANDAAKKKLEALKGKEEAALQSKADEATTEKIQAAAELQWNDRTARADGADREQWRGLWNERPAMAREQAKLEAEQARANPAKAQAAVDEKTEDANPEDMRSDGVEVSEDEKPLISQEEAPGEAATSGRNAPENAGPVQGRSVRRRQGAGRVLAGVGQGVGKALSTTGGVIGFDGGENDLKAGNLKTAAAKAAMSEVWQNFGTGGLAKVPVVGDYAKTAGLAVYTPIGEGIKKVGGALEEASFGKEDRDRLFNKHWGLESPTATDATREKRAELRAQESGMANTINDTKTDYFSKAQKLKALEDRGLVPGDTEVLAARDAVDLARKEVFEQQRGLREVEGELGYSRRRQLARTGLVMPARAEADFNQPQTPLTEEQIQQHREKTFAGGKSPLSAALPKQVQVYKSKSGAAKKSEEPNDPVASDQPQMLDDDVIQEAPEELEDEDKVAGADQTQMPDMNLDWLQPDFQPEAGLGRQALPQVQQEETDPMKKYEHIFNMKTDKDFNKYLDGDEAPKKGKKRKK